MKLICISTNTLFSEVKREKKIEGSKIEKVKFWLIEFSMNLSVCMSRD